MSIHIAPETLAIAEDALALMRRCDLVGGLHAFLFEGGTYGAFQTAVQHALVNGLVGNDRQAVSALEREAAKGVAIDIMSIAVNTGEDLTYAIETMNTLEAKADESWCDACQDAHVDWCESRGTRN